MTVLGLAVLLALPWRAAAQTALAPEKGWELDDPGAGNPGGPVSPPDSPSGPEWQRFWDHLQTRVFDDICRNIKLPVSQSFKPTDSIGLAIEIERSLARYPDQRFAIIDRAKLGVSLGLSEPLVPSGADIPLAISFGARAEGEAYVIRPLDGKTACKELKTLLNVFDFKTVIPISSERLVAMKVGELWKLPLVLSAGASIGAGVPYGPASVSLSLGYSQSNTSSVTLLRLKEDALRLRIRLDHAKLTNAGGSVSVSFPLAGALGLDQATGFLQKEGEKLLIRELNHYLANSLGLDYWKRDGRKVLLEFVLDPREPEQMDNLAKFLKGNINAFAILTRIIKAAANPKVRNGELQEELAQLEGRRAEALGADSSFSGASDYKRGGSRFHLQLPLLVRHESDRDSQSDNIVTGAKDYFTDIRQASAQQSNAWFNVPFLGEIVKKNSQKTVQAMARVDFNGMPQAPFLAYIQQDGFVRHREGAARDMVVSANAIMRLAGTRGEGENPDMVLPVDKLFPKRDEAQSPSNPLYRSAMSAFTVVFNQEAIQQMLWAPAEVVLKSFMNALDPEDQGLLKTVLAYARISAEGILELDRSALRRELERTGRGPWDDDPNDRGVYQMMVDLAQSAAGMVRDLVEARGGDWKERLGSISKLVSKGGHSGLKYDEAMKVLVQLVDPANLYGEFRMQTNKKREGEKDVSARYLLHRERQDPAFMEEIQLKERFSEPSLLSD